MPSIALDTFPEHKVEYVGEGNVVSISLYCGHMQSINARLKRIKELVPPAGVATAMAREQWELVFLNLRKALEELAFSSLVANKDAYMAAYADFAKNWKMKNLFKRLEAVNPKFYPEPVTYTQATGTGRPTMVPVTVGFLLQDEVVFLHGLCSEFLHTWNPYRPGGREIETRRDLEEWIQRFQRLLDNHYIHLVDGTILLTEMVNAQDGLPQARHMVPVPPGFAPPGREIIGIYPKK